MYTKRLYTLIILLILFNIFSIFNIKIVSQLYLILYMSLFFGFSIFLITYPYLDSNFEDISKLLFFLISTDIAFVIAVGVLINFLVIPLQIKPLSKPTLIIVFSIISLAFIVYIFFIYSNKLYSISNNIYSSIPNLRKFIKSKTVILCTLLPFLSYIGDYFLNYFNSNILLLTLFATIALLCAYMVLNSKRNIYGYSILCIALSMLYYRSFANLTNTGEKYMPYIIAHIGKWNPELPAGHNMLLPNVILHPIYIVLTNLPTIYELAIVHPFIISFIPVGIYHIYYKLTKDYKIAFILSFIYIGMFPFYKLMAVRVRTPMAIFFFVSAVFCIFYFNEYCRKYLITIFSFMVVVSHYGVSFIIIIVLIISTLLKYILDGYKDCKYDIVNSKYVLLFSTITFWWYIFVARGKRYIDIVNFIHRFVINLLNLNFSKSYTIYSFKAHYPLSIRIIEYLNIFIVLVSIIGAIYILKFKAHRKNEFYLLSLSSLVILFSTLLPVKIFNTARVIEFAYIFVLPLFYIGIRETIKLLHYNENKIISILCIFSLIFFLFNCGFVSEVITKDYAPYAYIDKPRILHTHNTYYKIYLYRMYSPSPDILTSSWITKHTYTSKIIFCDFFTLEKDLRYRNTYIPEYGITPNYPYKPRVKLIDPNTTYWESEYIFLSEHNILYNFYVYHWNPPLWEYISTNRKLVNTLIHSERIYYNKHDAIYIIS